MPLFEPLSESFRIIVSEFPLAVWETLYATVLATALSIVFGLPLGVLLASGGKGGVLPLPKALLQALNLFINVLRSIPFLILMILVIPLTRALVGKAYGTAASIVPLVIAAFPFVARLVESSLNEVGAGLIEAARSMGATPLQIIVKVLLKESVPSLLSNLTIAATTILGYTAMSGAVGGGGLGKLAITYGYNRYMYGVMAAAVLLLIALVQLLQTLGSRAAAKADKRKP